ncbi:SRPBCC domain-containing protein [Nocardioides sp. GXQ0305]|uniref:SRPBCC domain-containing protein n=1 Tax=Nocardioides sp. GXQ0305 TaxID=3423912 RepID=UPI003D7DFD99
MSLTAHVYQIHINADADQVWAAITRSQWKKRYFHGTSYAEGPTPGARYRTVKADGGDAIDGVIEEMTPPTDGRPGRFVQTWHVLYDAELAAEPPSRVEWTIEQVGDRLTRVRLVHGGLAFSPLTWANVKDGWVWVLDALKTVLETGRTLPRITVEPEDAAAPAEGDWHRRQGVEATHAAFRLLDGERDPTADEELLRLAYAAAYHWERAEGSLPANAVRADYLVSRALGATGQPDRALVAADRALAACLAHGIADFDLAYAHEARARALSALGRTDEAGAAWRAARAVEVADPEDRAIVEADFAAAAPTG